MRAELTIPRKGWTMMQLMRKRGGGRKGGGGKGNQDVPQYLSEMPTGWVGPWRGVDPVRPPARDRGKEREKGRAIHSSSDQNIRLVMSAGNRDSAMPPFTTGTNLGGATMEKPLASAAPRSA